MPQYGSWKEVRELGRGSFGAVYEIEQTDELGFTTRSALKAIRIPQSETQLDELRSKGATEEEVAAYFREMAMGIMDEVRTMYHLRGSTNIVHCEDHQIRRCEDGVSWELLIRMELLTPLRQYVREHPITRKTVIKLGIDICRALEQCRRHSIIHRDIKPGNILVNADGDFKLSDFGIARSLSEEETMAALSQKGTMSYMAPEVYMGDPYSYSVDLYSLGLVMYQLLNHNREPFLPPYPSPIRHGDQNRAMLRRLKGEALPLPTQEQGELGEVVLRACAFDPSERYDSPRQMREALESLLLPAQDRSLEVNGDTLNIPSTGRSVSTEVDAAGSDQSAEEKTFFLFGDAARPQQSGPSGREEEPSDGTRPLRSDTGPQNRADTGAPEEAETVTPENETAEIQTEEAGPAETKPAARDSVVKRVLLVVVIELFLSVFVFGITGLICEVLCTACGCVLCVWRRETFAGWRRRLLVSAVISLCALPVLFALDFELFVIVPVPMFGLDLLPALAGFWIGDAIPEKDHA